MKTVLTFNMEKETTLPVEFSDYDVRFPKSLPLYFIEEFTNKWDIIFDPFAWYWTTLIATEEIWRIPYWIEFEKNRFKYIKSQILNKENIINWDSLKLEEYNLPMFDFVFTSPPYMASNHTENPFTAYMEIWEGYKWYLRDIEKIFSNIKKNTKEWKYIVIEIANIKNEFVTTLAWDVCKVISNIFTFEKEIIINWEDNKINENWNYWYWYDHSYCLIFRN